MQFLQKLRKIWENIEILIRKYRHIKFVTTERRRNDLVLQPNYLTAKIFTEQNF